MNIVRIILCLCAISVIAAEVPRHLFLFLTGVQNEVQVSFTLTNLPQSPAVSYGTSATNLESKIAVKDVHKFIHPVNVTEIQYICTATISKLTPSKTYFYEVCGDPAIASTCAPVSHFNAPPAPSNIVKLGLYGDLGSYGTSLIETGGGGLKAAVAKNMFDAIVQYGDFAYNLATNDGKNGETFMNNLEAISSRVPYMALPGNHEFFVHDGPSKQYYLNYFHGQTLLGNHSGSSNPLMWWSFDIGSVHIVGISTEVYCEDTSNIAVQYEWFENDLKKAASRADKPWIVVLGHRQLFSTLEASYHMRMMRYGLQCTDSTLKTCNHSQPCDSGKNCAYSVQALLGRYKVDMYFAGHEHFYRRHYPITPDANYELQNLNTYVNPQHTVYIISGAPGIQNAPPTSIFATAPAAFALDGPSYSVLEVHNNTHLFFKQITTSNGDVVDDVWIVKDSKRPPWTKLSSFKFANATGIVCDQ